MTSARLDQVLAEEATTGSPAARLDQVLVEYAISYSVPPMIPTVAFPDFTLAANGAGWSVHRSPTWSTQIAAAVSGREVRNPNYVLPLYAFELTYDALLSGGAPVGALGAQTLQALMGFFLQMQGQLFGFLFTDPDFCQQAAGLCGAGNGSATTFPLVRSVGNYTEQVQAANVVTAVYVNGVALASSAWALSNGNELVLSAAPANGALVTADFSYYFVCRFTDDVHDYEEFMAQLHTLKSCKFRSVRAS